ncbi:MAG: two-component system, NtrC family, nitrogen regulation sensor histidine kinase GlnL [Parcubacteria group bacterium Gr01-1014_70]|nr:MAG: two-component system, NtrC family, nitrogen regulation sensor histidine kinase GlnL [Parcubacteria group bacterium Gr01-1014_70]
MELFAISGLVNALVAVGFGVLVFSKNWRERQNQIFLLMTAALAVWGFSYWRWLSSSDAETALFWVRILAVGSVFIPVFFLDWVTVLLQRGKKLRDFVALAYLGSVAVSAFALTDHFIAGIGPKLWFPFWPDAGALYSIYIVVLYIGVVLWSVHALYHEWRNEADTARRGQLLYVLWGAVLGFGGGLTNFFLWFDVFIPPYGNFLVAAFPFLLGYSVLKYKLFNMKTVTAELIAFALWVFTLIITFLAENIQLKLVYGFFMVLMGIGGVILIKAVYKTEKLSEELAVANKGQEELIHTVSHEVKGGLAQAGAAFAAIIEDDYVGNPEAMKSMLREALVSNKQDVSRLEQTLMAFNPRLGTEAYDISEFDVREALAETVNHLKPEAEAKGLALEVRANDMEKYTVKGDRAKIASRVLHNLIENAILYTPSGRITASLSKKDGKVLLEVKDTGVGISPEDRAALFTKGGHGKEAIKVNAHSTGNGLYLAKVIVEKHNGRIWAESAGYGKGSTFFVELPSV